LTRGVALLVLVLLGGACGGPALMVPGGELTGEVVTTPIDDWSFVDDRFVDLETRPGDPYSVELNYVVRDGHLYIDAAESRTWHAYIRADPDVRVRFDGRIYPVKAVRVERAEELAGFDPDRTVYRLESRDP